MFRPEGVLKAARRWLELLERSEFAQAATLIRTDPKYGDLTATQYAAARDLLIETGLLKSSREGLCLDPTVENSSSRDTARILFARSIEATQPAWLQDADELVLREDELPSDAADLASSLGLSEREALISVRQVFGHIDLARRSEIGMAGERGLINALEDAWPGSTRHVALEHDGLGYDIEAVPGDDSWHLEVKSTTRRGRLVLHLSRQEYEISRADPRWRLVALGLDAELSITCVATVSAEVLEELAPGDKPGGARWESARYELAPSMLEAGLRFLDNSSVNSDESCWLLEGHHAGSSAFGWMPQA